MEFLSMAFSISKSNPNAFSDSNNEGTRGIKNSILYGRRLIETFSKESIALLCADPNFRKQDTILHLHSCITPKRKRCGKWLTDEARNGITLTHISMCIKENTEQTLASLAFRVAYEKNVNYMEAVEELQVLRDTGSLFYYAQDFQKMQKVRWSPGEDNDLIEAVKAYVKDKNR